VVGDAWQNRGLGRRMMARLIAIARERGLKRMVGQVLAGNDAMLELCARLGFEVERDGEDARLRRVSVALA
jgi:acetyltransferase